VLNIDLSDFFPSINFGRVRGLFMHFPYNIPEGAATVLAQLCCHDNQLPQGAPTSPVVSNMICARLDSQLRLLAKENRCMFSRYADDLSFSTTLRDFPPNIAAIDSDGSVTIGSDLSSVITSNGFEVNLSKVRLQSRHQRQEVTGLVANVFPNVPRTFVREVRAMLNDWTKNGEKAAEAHHRRIPLGAHRPDFKDLPSFRAILKGKIDYIRMIKGRDDPVYLRFLYRYASLDKDYKIPSSIRVRSRGDKLEALVFTEGKTDWQHMKAALRRFHADQRLTELKLRFSEDDVTVGGDKLARRCSVYSMHPEKHDPPAVFIFDTDDMHALAKAKLPGKPFYLWGKNVISIALNTPGFRDRSGGVCTELLYRDGDIQIKDGKDRRLFLSTEFHPDSGRHLKEDLTFRGSRDLHLDQLAIIDHDVFDLANRNIALPKAEFAEYVLNGVGAYGSLDISAFEPLFQLIAQILKAL